MLTFLTLSLAEECRCRGNLQSNNEGILHLRSAVLFVGVVLWLPGFRVFNFFLLLLVY